ncbi:unnamed protein product [Acanthosepion pharaonis]|uniref:Uncharacterized protein n=1 Tax=Acanthosepion pharaonis TaxID=158019 RepID=A0A812BL65_ACAPH|nr:unnamed protein product [Sepia pharaonis]
MFNLFFPFHQVIFLVSYFLQFEFAFLSFFLSFLCTQYSDFYISFSFSFVLYLKFPIFFDSLFILSFFTGILIFFFFFFSFTFLQFLPPHFFLPFFIPSLRLTSDSLLLLPCSVFLLSLFVTSLCLSFPFVSVISEFTGSARGSCSGKLLGYCL